MLVQMTRRRFYQTLIVFFLASQLLQYGDCTSTQDDLDPTSGSPAGQSENQPKVNTASEQQPSVLKRENGKSTHLQILDSLLKEYDRRATPSNHLNNATTVACEVYIRSFGSIDPSSMDYQVDLYLRQTWYDARLKHEDLVQPLDLNDPNLVKAIWKPEVYFPNAKDADFQFVTVPNVLVRINPHGEILYMLRLKLTFACMMELSKFPLDTQVCTIEIASFSKTMQELVLQWKLTKEPIKMHKDLRMPQFQMQDIVATTCQEASQIGNYSCLVAEFHLQRSVGFHLVQSYLPTILIVAISWVSFWMDVDSVPGRTTLGVTTLLTVSTKSSEKLMMKATSEYIIDIFFFITAFVFSALLEFTLVNYLWRKNASQMLPHRPYWRHPNTSAPQCGRHRCCHQPKSPSRQHRKLHLAENKSLSNCNRPTVDLQDRKEQQNDFANSPKKKCLSAADIDEGKRVGLSDETPIDAVKSRGVILVGMRYM
ncbi:glycine receptor subunit alpha-4-like [Hyalella azteca]|uniref:Glycine receptor subunit alpha-4-like n=2 Tax=Hyalella azteca TaxID=294128 RepID=A0A979FKB3_HYAAZ|nr:glycine receptor subunit alpha-4-like [Hyalella azteca]